ncbi:MAG: DUF2771 family protein [Nakamurella sp.]
MSSRSRIARSTRWAAAAVALPAALLLTGCTAPLPDVTVYGDRSVVTVDPSLWCAPDASDSTVNCRVNTGDADAPRLRLAKGSAVSVNVPALVGEAPWVVLFDYRDAQGKEQQARGPLFASDTTQNYVLHPPDPADQLLRVEIQSGLIPMAAAPGTGITYAATHNWVLLIDPA